MFRSKKPIWRNVVTAADQGALIDGSRMPKIPPQITNPHRHLFTRWLNPKVNTMNKTRKHFSRTILTVLLLVLGLMMTTSTPQAQSNTTPGVIPPNARPYGMTYGDWGGKWWQWALSFQLADIPFYNTGGPVDISAGQSGHVWFLAGANNGLTAPREGVIPAGTALFLPLGNLINDYPCPPQFGFEPNPGESLEQFLQRTGNGFMPQLTDQDLFAEIDGVSVKKLSMYRSISHLFYFTADPALSATFDPCVTGTSQPGVSIGYYLMLNPLPPGQHTLHFGTVSFGQDITYNLTVLP